VLKDGHQGGCHLDPNFVKDSSKPAGPSSEKKPPSMFALQYADALMAAIQHESSIGGGDMEE
jgi:hypothetical protein